MADTPDDFPFPDAQRLSELRDRLLALATPERVTSGILDLSPPAPPIVRNADGSEGSPRLTKLGWREIYFRLRNSALEGFAPQSLDDIEAIAEKYRRAGSIPIAIGRYRYHAPRAAFVARVLGHATSAEEFAMPETAEEALEEKQAFFAAALERHEFDLFFPTEPIHRGLNARYVVPSELFLTNGAERPSHVTVDFGDGNGPRAVALDQHVAVDYPSEGTKALRVQATVGGQQLTSSFELNVVPPTASAPPANETWPVLASTIAYEGVTATGHAWVYYGAGHTQIVNPVIVAEGFPGGYTLDYLYSVLNTQGLITSILAQGQDVIIVGFDDGTTYLEANAGVIVAAIQKAQSEQAGSASMVVGGASMGGIITRYALAYMEQNSIAHNTTLYFSFDSPHTGATVPLSLLYFANQFASHSSFVQDAQTLLTSIAAQELAIYSLTDDTQAPVTPSPLRTTFVTNLAGLGNWPQLPYLVGVSNGVATGAANATTANALAVSFSATCASASLYSAIGDTSNSNLIYRGRIAFSVIDPDFPLVGKTASGPQFDSAPGGTSTFFEQIATGLQAAGYTVTANASVGTFIPAISSQAMESLSPYNQSDLYAKLATTSSSLDAHLADTTNDPHVTVTPAIATFLLQQLAGNQTPKAQRAAAATQKQVQP
jgi:hypothetical protein